jgi:pyrroloquinoline quinone biosynthesis protein D
VSRLPEAPLTIAPGFRLQWEEAQQAYVLLYPEGMIRLNASAGEILKRCDGTRTVEAIVADLERQFPGVELAGDVREFLEEAYGRGWIRGE